VPSTRRATKPTGFLVRTEDQLASWRSGWPAGSVQDAFSHVSVLQYLHYLVRQAGDWWILLTTRAVRCLFSSGDQPRAFAKGRLSDTLFRLTESIDIHKARRQGLGDKTNNR